MKLKLVKESLNDELNEVDYTANRNADYEIEKYLQKKNIITIEELFGPKTQNKETWVISNTSSINTKPFTNTLQNKLIEKIITKGIEVVLIKCDDFSDIPSNISSNFKINSGEILPALSDRCRTYVLKIDDENMDPEEFVNRWLLKNDKGVDKMSSLLFDKFCEELIELNDGKKALERMSVFIHNQKYSKYFNEKNIQSSPYADGFGRFLNHYVKDFD